MAQFEYWMTTDLKRGSSQVQVLHGQTFTQDNLGNRVGVVVMDGGEPATLSGTVSGYVIRSDGGTVVVVGAMDGNKAYIDLPESAYAVPGQIQIAIRLTSGSTKTVLGALNAYVQRSATGTIIDPGHVIPDIDDIIAKMDEMDEAIDNAEAATDAANDAAVAAGYCNITSSKSGNVITVTTTDNTDTSTSHTVTDPSGMIAPSEATSTAAAAHAQGSYLIYDGTLYQVTADIAIGDTLATTGTGANIVQAPGGAMGEVADLKSATTNLETNANFFNQNYTIDGYALQYSNGDVTSQSVAFITDFIPVRPGAKIIVNQHLNSERYANVFYASNKSTIIEKYYCNADGINLIAPENAAYIRVCGILAQKSAMRVLVFDSPLPQFNTVDALDKYMLYGTDVFSGVSLSEGYAIRTSDWSVVSLSGAYVSDYIPVKQGEIYRIENNIGSIYYGHGFYKKLDNSYVAVSGYPGMGDYNGQTGYKYITVPKSAEYLRITGRTDMKASQKVTYCNLVGKDLIDYICANLLNDVNTGYDFFDANYTVDGYAIRYSNGDVVTLSSAFITDFIPVRPGAKVVVNQHLNSTTYANVFYGADKSIVSKVYCNAANGTYLTAPANAYYFRACGVLANKSDMKVLVYDGPLPHYNTVDALEKYLLFGANVFDGSKAAQGYGLKSDGGVYAFASGYVSNYIPVKPGEIYRIENNLGSYIYCHCFFKQNGASYAKVGDAVTSIGDYNGQTGYKYVIVPAGAEYLRITGSTALIASQKITYCNLCGKDLVTYLETVATTHGRITLKAPSDTIDGFDHAGFPSSVFFAGKQIVAARLGKQHFTPDSSSDWGGIKFFVQNPDGSWSHDRALITSSDFNGMSGELRDPNIGITRDGQYLILAGWSTYKIDGTDVHDCVIATFDSDLEIVSYKVFPQATDLFWGNALITPNGKLLVGSYNTSYAVKVNQSTAVFDPTDLSSLEFVQTQIHNSGTEVTLGYVGNKLYALMRTGSGGYLNYTSNLEGDSGWVTASRFGNEVDAPVLPYAQPDNGRLFFGGAYYVSANYRYPCIGYIDTNTNQLLTSGNVDSAVTGYSGYCGIVSFGGNEYGVAYYEDFGTSAALYYQRINAGYILPAAQYYA